MKKMLGTWDSFLVFSPSDFLSIKTSPEVLVPMPINCSEAEIGAILTTFDKKKIKVRIVPSPKYVS